MSVNATKQTSITLPKIINNGGRSNATSTINSNHAVINTGIFKTNSELRLGVDDSPVSSKTSDYVFSNVDDDTIWGKMYNAITYPLRTNKTYAKSRKLDLTDESWYYYNSLDDRAINSLADVIAYYYNLTPQNTTFNPYRPLTESEAQHNIDVINKTQPYREAAMSEWLTRTIAEPIKKAYENSNIFGNYLFVNNLGSFGEAVDYFSGANAVKSSFRYIPTTQKYTPDFDTLIERVKAGYLGYTDTDGVYARKQYDVDVQVDFDGDPDKTTLAETITNMAINLPIEALSDPVNMTSIISGAMSGTGLFGGRVDRNVANAINQADEITTLKHTIYSVAAEGGLIVKEADDVEIITELNKVFSFTGSDARAILTADLKGRIAGKIIRDVPKEDLGSLILKNLIYNRMENSKILKPIANILKAGELKGEGLDLIGTFAKKIINDLRTSSLAKVNYKLIKSVSAINDISTSYDDITTAFAGAPLFTPVFHTARYLVPGAFHIASSAISKAAKGATVTLGNVKMIDPFKANDVFASAKSHLKVLEGQLDTGIENILNTNFVEDYIQGLTEVSAAYQLQKLSEVLLNGSEDEETLRAVQELVEALTKNSDQGACHTVREYVTRLLEIYNDDANKILLQKIQLPKNLIVRLEALVALEDNLTKNTKALNLLRAFNIFIDIESLTDTTDPDILAYTFKTLRQYMLSFKREVDAILDYIKSTNPDEIDNDLLNEVLNEVINKYEFDIPNFAKNYNNIPDKPGTIRGITKAISDRLNSYVPTIPRDADLFNWDKRGVYRIGTIYQRLVNSWIKLGIDLNKAKTNQSKLALLENFESKIDNFEHVIDYYKIAAKELESHKKVLDDLSDVFNQLKTPREFFNEIYTRMRDSSGFVRMTGVDDNVPFEKVKTFLDMQTLEEVYRYAYNEKFDSTKLNFETVGDFRKDVEDLIKMLEEDRDKLQAKHFSEFERNSPELAAHNAKIEEINGFINTLNKFDTTFDLLEWKNESLVMLHTESASRTLEVLSNKFIKDIANLFDAQSKVGEYFLGMLNDTGSPRTLQEILTEVLNAEHISNDIKDNLNVLLSNNTDLASLTKSVKEILKNKTGSQDLLDILDTALKQSQKLPDDLVYTLRDIKAALDYIETLRIWYQNVALTFPDSSKFTAFIEAIENFANNGLTDLKIFNSAKTIAWRMQMNLDRIFNPIGSVSLGMYRGRLAMNDDEFIKVFQEFYGNDSEMLQRMLSNAHTDSGIDVRVTELVNEYLSTLFSDSEKQADDVLSKVKNLIEGTDKTYAYFDIETVDAGNRAVEALSENTGAISQFTLRFSNNDMTTYILKEDIDSGLVDPGFFSNNVQICDNELDLLTKVQDDIISHKTIYLFGQNSDRFDLPFIQQRLWDLWDNGSRTIEEKLALKKSNLFYGAPLDYMDDEGSIIFYDILHSYNKLYNIPYVDANDIKSIDELMNIYFEAAYTVGSNTLCALDYPKLLRDIQRLSNEFERYCSTGATKGEKQFTDLATQFLNELLDGAKIERDNFYNSSRRLLGAVDLDEYGKPLGHKYIRNVFKEHADINKIRELAKKLEISEEDLLRRISLELNCPPDELLRYLQSSADFRLSNVMNESEFEAYGKLIDNWWQEHYFYAYLGKEGETEEEFFKILRGGRERLTSLLNAGTELGNSSRVSYKNAISITDFTYDDYFNLNKIPEYVQARVIEQLRNENKAIQNLVNSGIKDAKAIYSLGLGFENREELLKTVTKFINELDARYGDASWVHYINLDNFKTDSQLAALWYRLMFYKRYIYRASDEMQTTQSKYIDMLQDAMFKKFNQSVLLTKRATWLEEFAYDDLPLEIQLDSEIYQAMNASERVLQYLQSLDYIPGAGANEFAHRVLMADAKALARNCTNGVEINGTKVNGALYTRVLNKLFSESTHDVFSQHIINKILDEDFDYIISKLLYDDLFYTFDLTSPIHKLNEQEYLYYKTVEQLLEHADAFAEHGVIITKGLGGQIVVGLSSDGIVDVSSTTRAFRGVEYARQDPILFQITKSKDSFILDEDIDRINRILRYNYDENGMGFGHSLTKTDAENAYKWAGVSDTKSLGIRSLDQRLDEKFFDNGVVYNNTNLTFSSAPRSGASYNIVNLFKNTGYITNMKNDFDLFLDIFFNPNSEMQASNIFKGISEEEILRAIKDDDSIVFAKLIKDNSRQGFHIKRIDVGTISSVKYILNKNNNVVMVPYQVYSSAFDAINTTELAHSRFHNIWHNYVVHTFKIPYLTSIGTVLRNIIDSNLKAWIDTADPISMIKNTIQSLQDYKNYSKTMQDFYNWLGDPAHKFFQTNTSSINQYYKYLSDSNITPIMPQSDFFRIHGFINNGPSAGITLGVAKAEKKYLRQQTKLAKEQGIEIPSKKIPEQIKNVRSLIDSYLMLPMSLVEQNVRYAEYLTWLEHGVTKTQAFQEVSKTAFNYSLKSESAEFLEQIIPFYNFQKLNLMYWVRAISDNAWLAKLLEDVTQTGYDTYNLSYDEYEANKSIQYHLLAGNIQLGDSGLILKLSPSYADAFKILMEPVAVGFGIHKGVQTGSPILGVQKWAQESNVLSSVLAPIQVAIEYTLDELVKDEYLKSIPFGKYEGKPIEYLLEDRAYVQKLLDSNYAAKIKQYYPSVYQKLIDSLNYQPRYISFGKFKDNPQPASILLDSENRGYAQMLLGSEISENPWLSTYYKPIYDMLIANGLNNDPVMPWGKYAGQPISEIPQSYKNYLMTSKDDNGNYWLYNNWPYLYDIFAGKRNTIIPKEAVITDTVISTAEATGLLYYSALENPESAESTFKNFGKNFITDDRIIPWWNVISTRLDTSSKIRERLDAPKAYKVSASLFPTVFSAIKTSGDYEHYETYANTVKNFYTNTTTTQQKPMYSSQNMAQQSSNARKGYNYYKPKKSYYTPTMREAYRKYNKKYGDVIGLRLNIAQLKLGV